MIKFIVLTIACIISLQMDLQAQHRYLALGDSYTIGESVTEGERWPNQLADSLRKKGINISKPRIIATTGWRTDNLKNAMNIAQLKPEYDFVSLLIGVNNQYQGKSAEQYAIEFEDLLLTAIHLAKGNKQNVFVVSIPDYGFTPFGKPKQEAIAKAINQFNAINNRITHKHNIQYFNITEISRKGLQEPDLVANDGLHPSGKMYAQWVQLIVKDWKWK
ncbi:MAG: SGNH/GDSL hydrolase family protein [Flammeovirgaceae bacterium]